MCSDVEFMCINIVIHMSFGKRLLNISLGGMRLCAAVYAAILFLQNLAAVYAPWIFGLQDCRLALINEEMV